MKFTITREDLLRSLQLVTGVVERRQTLPVLSNLLVEAKDSQLLLTGTDLEVELLVVVSDIAIEQEGAVTIPARKLADIWKSLPEGSAVSVTVNEEKATVVSGRSRFTLSTLPASEFPKVEGSTDDSALELSSANMQRLLHQVSFSMAQQDVRYFLNGMLLEITGSHTRAVATDGRRLAMCTIGGGIKDSERLHAIIPRKGVLEIGRLIDESEEPLRLSIGPNHLRVTHGPCTLTTKLVDGKFPDYEKVIPRDAARVITGDRETLRQGFTRASILSNEKYRGIRLLVDGENLTIQANNPEQEEAEEIVPIDYDGEPMEIGFNVSYLLDILSVLRGESVQVSVSNANSSAVVEGPSDDDSIYVVMPMRL